MLLFFFTSTEEHSKLWKTAATCQLLLPVKDDLGSCWIDLGIALNLSSAKLHNIEDDYNFNRDKAFAVLYYWLAMEGSRATMGHLVVALCEIGRKDIAYRLIGMLFFVSFCVRVYLRWLKTFI